MTWQRVRAEFEALLERPQAERDRRLDELAAIDRPLADELRSLLAQDAAAGAFLERAPAALAAPGQQLGGYRLLRPLGSGGMGAVWEAEHDARRRVALKLVPRSPASAAERWRFAHEARVLAALDHPGIARFFAAGTDDLGGTAVAWLAMELVDGAVDVLRWADANALSRDARLALLVELCAAVAHGHQRGVLHRDLKPGNVLVGADGRLKLIDFGVARVLGADGDEALRTRTGEIVGTLQYMAPEQLRGEVDAIGTTSDVYALGVLAYHLLCGRAPFDLADRPFAAIAAIVLEQEPLAPRAARPDLPADLGWILLRALEKDPARRYPTVDALVADLERWRAHLPVQARRAGAGYRVRKFVRRHRVGVGVAAVIAASLALGGYGLWRGAVEARAAEQLALRGAEQARRGELAALQARDLSAEVLRITIGLFEAVDEGAGSRELTVHELLDAAVIDERATRDPRIEQAVREVRGNAYTRIGRHAEARREYERCRELDAAVLAQVAGTDDEVTARGRGQVIAARLGRALAHTGEAARGDALLRDAYDATAVDASGLHRSNVLHALCSHLGEHNLDAELVERARELLALAEQRGDRQDRIVAWRWLAKALGALERHDEAKVAAAAAEREAAAIHGDRHPQSCAALATLVTVLQEAGDLDEAERRYPELIARTREVYGAGHPNLLTTLNNHAHLLLARGKADAALDTLRAVLAVYEARGGVMTVEHLLARHNLGQMLNARGKLAEAEPLLRSAAAASRQLLRADDPDGAKMRLNHGACLAWSKRFAEAEPVLLEAHDTLVRLLPAGHDVLAKARRTIADAYRVNGRPDEAAAWRAK